MGRPVVVGHFEPVPLPSGEAGGSNSYLVFISSPDPPTDAHVLCRIGLPAWDLVQSHSLVLDAQRAPKERPPRLPGSSEPKYIFCTTRPQILRVELGWWASACASAISDLQACSRDPGESGCSERHDQRFGYQDTRWLRHHVRARRSLGKRPTVPRSQRL